MKDARSKILECVLVLERSKRRSVGPDEQGTREAVWARGKKLHGFVSSVTPDKAISVKAVKVNGKGVNGVKAVVTVEI